MAVDLAMARKHLNFDVTDTDDDDELQFFVDAANEWMATAVTDMSPKPVQLGTLELIRHLWDTQRGPAAMGLSGDEEGGRGFIGFAIPNRVRELIEPWAAGSIRGGRATGSFPDAACWPDPNNWPVTTSWLS